MAHDTFETQIHKRCTQAKILIVDDSPIFIAMYESMLSELGECYCVGSAKEALSLLAKHDFDVALFDHHLPDGTGLRLCKMVRRVHSSRQLPIFIITGSSDETLEQKCWEVDCSDFISKPFHAITLKHRVLAQLRLKFAVDLLQETSNQDQLTGLHNRRAIDDVIQRRSLRKGHVFSIAILDVDFFKKFNDEYGHQAGDECLVKVASIMKSCVRGPDKLSVRYGGEEFLILLPDTELKDAIAIAERVRSEVAKAQIPHIKSPMGVVTLSAGVATYGGDCLTWRALLKAADECLYQAKREGRNRLVSAL
ncbi:diguanylate cyclase [Alteromonas sediminis]|uniref:diguanylate cyclase n=1 Tax=Alteromonas sediminis TaxID=2259342 RepID=A0A3N5YP83_9ALTE|nr:diguanylate cyclase [Alteromonas sediminis]RPJ67631.1 diguanylate cyclase [Alteromonas sediminis]